MEEDCSDLMDWYFASEAANNLFDPPWTDESVLSGNNNKMADDEEDRAIQDLFDGETNPEVEQESSESSGEESNPSDVMIKDITDENIANIGVQELNKLLRNVPEDEAARIRKRRRNLKNRGYALTCRIRKQQQHDDLINENTSLKKQLQDGKLKLLKVWKEKEAYKRKYLQLQQSFTVHK